MSPVISANVSDDVADRIEEQREENGDQLESRSAAVDRLIRAGLEEQEREGGVFVTHAALVAFFGWFLVIGAFVEVAPTAGTFGFAIVGAGFVYSVANRLGWV